MRRVLAAGGLAMLLAGCAPGDVEAPVPRANPTAMKLCPALHAHLPFKVHGSARRTTSPRSPLVTAWGTPAIVVRCGVPRPVQLHPTSELVVINGVSWLGVPVDRPVTFTAVGRAAYVEVTVPSKYTPPGDVLIELAAAIKAAVPANSDASL